jgi:aminoglycoside/choline kinase family phosphotransferase
MTDRESRLQEWARRQLVELHGVDAGRATLLNLSGDASFRRYFRTQLPDATYIVVDAPPQTEDNHAFVRIANAFRDGGVHTPRILAVDYEQGFMLQEDFGDALYLAVLNRNHDAPDRVDALYRRAIDALVTLQKNVGIDFLPPYDARLLNNEMQLFQDWFCGRFLELQLQSDEEQLILDCQQFLTDNALDQPRVAVHRDYHSRNLMVPDPGRYPADFIPGVIDFQDAVAGAYTYDLVSLLRDCYISWPLSYVQVLALYYRQQAEAEGVISAISEAEFFRHFDLMGLQRNLKVIGIFARLCIRDNKPQFLADIPQTIRYFTEVAAGYPELEEFLQWFRQRILPLAEQRLSAGQSRNL